MRTLRHVLVTGASAGLGAGIAGRLAREGVILTLVSRRREGLEATGALCRSRGARVRIAPGDVADPATMLALIDEAEAHEPVDGVVACAGIGSSAGRNETPETALRIIDVNLAGAVNTAGPLLPRMAARGCGRVALIASLVGYLSIPDAPAYSASKAALIAWGDAQRRLWRGTGLRISIVCPGFIETDMVAGLPRPLPFLWTVERSARRIVAGFEAGEARIAFPWQMRALAAVGAGLPRSIQDRILRPRLRGGGASRDQERGRSS